MKRLKKIILIVIIIVICAVILFLFFRKKKVEKFSNISIIDSYNNEIIDYNENKMAFTIKTNNKKVLVNGIEYEEGQRFYEIGEYKIKVIDGLKIEESTIKINEIEKTPENEYNIYVTTVTLQTLFAMLDMSENVNQKGFLWTQRTQTLNFDIVKEKFKNIQISQYLGETDEYKIKKQLVSEIKDYIKNVLQNDKNAYFNLYIDEYRFFLELELFGKIGLNDNRYNVNIYSDGTLSYVREYEITEENKYERFLRDKEKYYQIVDNIKSNTGNYNDYPGSYLVDKESPYGEDYNYNYLLISTLKSNVRYLLQYPEMFVFKDSNIEQEMNNANLVKIVVQDEYNEIPEENKEIFFESINLDKEELDQNYFKDETAKYLVITGAKPFYGTIEQDDFERIIQEVCNEYQDEYTILYKPHPSGIPNEEQSEFLENLNIKILPGSIPMEAISFVYPNLKIGGFASSLYMSTDEGKTEFFFAENKSELVEPLNQLYDKLFSNAKFYY